jgi:hypothetical protein
MQAMALIRSREPAGTCVGAGADDVARTFVRGVPLEEISQLVGHSGTTVTELVYRHQLKPVIQTGATVMDRLFGA